MVSDQNASLGGSPPGWKCILYSWLPESGWPPLSTLVLQYIASCGTLIGPGKIRVCAARVNMPLPGRPHPEAVTQPLILAVLALARISIVTTASPNPTKNPCTSALRSVSESGKRKRLTTT